MRGDGLGAVERRRRWADAEKFAVVCEVGRHGASVMRVARRHDLRRQQIYAWRHDLLKKGLCEPEGAALFLPVDFARPPVFATKVRDLDGQCLLPPAQRRVIRHGPVQVCHLGQAGHHPGRLSERQLEEDLDGQAELDRRVKEHRGATWAAVRRREPDHVLVQPDQQRSALAKRRSVAGPVRGAVAGG